MWTEERDQTLISLWDAGESITSIGAQLGVSRCAVSGRMSRLRQAGVNLPARKIVPKVARRPRRPRKPPVTVAKPKPMKPAPLPPIPPVTSDSPSILSIGSHQCRFPMWDHSEPSTHESPLCGAPAHGKPYCPAHMKRAYRKVPE